MQRNSTRQARRAPLNATRMTSRAVHRAINGLTLRPNSDPPRIVVRPWNQLVVVVDGPATTFTVGTLYVAFQAQLLNSSTVPQALGFDFQIEDVRLWGDVSGSDGVRGRFYDLLGNSASSFQIISSQEDRPATNQRAVVGYRWPESQQRQVLEGSSATDLTPIFEHENAALAYIHLRWRLRPTDSNPLTTLTSATRAETSLALGARNGV